MINVQDHNVEHNGRGEEQLLLDNQKHDFLDKQIWLAQYTHTIGNPKRSFLISFKYSNPVREITLIWKRKVELF